MTTNYDLPLPGDAFDGRTVIASVWGNDSQPEHPIFGTVILLNPTSPFYSVGQIQLGDDHEWFEVPQEHRTHYNINFAVEDFANSGGDI